jgi:hypothetical protein
MPIEWDKHVRDASEDQPKRGTTWGGVTKALAIVFVILSVLVALYVLLIAPLE